MRKTIPYGSAETYPIAQHVGGGVLDAHAPEDGRRRPGAPRQWCAGCAREIEYVGRRTLPCTSWETRVQAVTPNVRNHPAPAVTQTRGVEDAAPYGHQRDEGIRIMVNGCAKAKPPPTPLAPLKGELSRRSAP